MIIIKANAQSEAGAMPSKELVEEMTRFNEEMLQAGVLVGGDGLHPSSKGARVTFRRGQAPTVIDGPFSETKELIAGFWILKTRSKEEAIEWVKKIPCGFAGDAEESTVEVRQIFDTEDFPPEVMSPEVAAREKAMAEELVRRQSAS